MACIDLATNAGVKIYIAAQTNLPTDMAQTNWEGVAATSWSEVSEVGSLGARGTKRNIIEYKTLAGTVCKQKGATNYGTMSFSVADIPTDAGQALMQTAVDSNLNFPFKVVHDDSAGGTNTPTIEYFPGLVGSWGMAQASDSDSIREREAEVALNGYLYVPKS
jgi:hypothetical protein